MRLLQVLLLVAIASGLAVGVLLLARGGSRGGNAAGTGTSAEALTGGRAVADDERVARLETLLEALSDQVARLGMELARLQGERRMALVPDPAGVEGIDPPEQVNDPAWYLEQYVDSFRKGGEGSEYFRLAVQAYLPSLLDPVLAIVARPSAHAVLRRELVKMLGDARFRLNARVVKALVARVAAGRDEPVMLAALDALERVADGRSAPSLERIVWGIRFERARSRCLELILQLAGDDANRSILALIRTAPDERSRALLISLVNTLDMETALEVFRFASHDERTTRLQAAHRVEEFRDEAFVAFVGEWIQREPDEEVRAVLGASHRKQQQIPSWHPMKMTGPPDVPDPARDHGNAWASEAPAGGAEWAELTYPQPFRAHTVRIFETCSAGAVVKVHTIDEGGGSHLVWSGVDPTEVPGVFEVTFQVTSHRVRRVRIELDTRRGSSWNEIDAVELVGPGARSWASSARASSRYGAASSRSMRHLGFGNR